MSQEEVYKVLEEVKPKYLDIGEIHEFIKKEFKEDLNRVSIYNSIKRMEKSGEVVKKEVIIEKNKAVKFVYKVKDDK